MISGNFKITYGSQQHRDILNALKSRVSLWETKGRSLKETEWNEAEESQVGFIHETENDAIRKTARRSGLPQYTTIEVPMSQAMRLSAHTYWTSVFLSRTPVLQFDARHGEPAQQVMAVEALMDYQTRVGRHVLPYYIWLHDAGKYGVGIIGQGWEDEEIIVSNIVEKPVKFLGIETNEVRKVRESRKVKGYQGNRLYNIRPHDYIFDPRVPMSSTQDGEFCGRMVRDFSLNDLIAGEQRGQYFNVKQLRDDVAGVHDEHEERGSSAISWPSPGASADVGDVGKKFQDPGFIDLYILHVRIVPRDWGLGQSEFPEKWVFTVAKKNFIIGARPHGENHGKFPFALIEQEIDGYSIIKRGIPEQQKSLNEVMSWLFNSHFYNVRSALNNQFVYDPSMLNPRDLADPAPGKRIRVRPEAYGRDIRTMIQQLPVTDVTRSNISDIQVISDLMQRSSGIVDNVMGMVNQGGRKTATEVRTSSSFGINRLKTVAEYMSVMGFEPLSSMMLQSTQQHYDQDQKFRIVGDLTGDDPFVDVTPDGIAGFYDYVPVDGSMPVDRFAQANLWREIMLSMQQLPSVAGQYDLAGMFTWVAQLAGMRNINQFKIQVTPDQKLAMQVQAGNMVPVGGSPAKGGGDATQGGQVSGVGPTG